MAESEQNIAIVYAGEDPIIILPSVNNSNFLIREILEIKIFLEKFF